MSFTRVPNHIIDKSKLNPYQFQLLSIVVRKTDGWCKVEDGISLSQFEALVTFKRPKIISTIQELIDMDLIVKTKHQKEDGGNSYNSYKIHDNIVTENNYPSNPELLGLVTEDYKQKKPITKETNTKHTPLQNEVIKAGYQGRSLKLAFWFIEYRKSIKKTINTLRPIEMFLKVIIEIQDKKGDIDLAISLMESKEWQTLSLDYLKDTNVFKTNGRESWQTPLA